MNKFRDNLYGNTFSSLQEQISYVFDEPLAFAHFGRSKLSLAIQVCMNGQAILIVPVSTI